MTIEITHDFVSELEDGVNTDVIRPSDWNNDHAFSGIQAQLTTGTYLVPKLLDTQNPSGASNFTFAAISGTTKEYLMKAYFTGESYQTFRLTLNADTTSGNYKTYIQLQESDGNNFHLTDWDTSRTISRIYDASPYITQFESVIVVVAGEGAFIRTRFSMLNSGWGDSGTYYHNSSFTDLTSIKIENDRSTFSGVAKLYERVDLTIP